MEVKTRKRTSPASCGHLVERDEKYLAVVSVTGEWVQRRTLCAECAQRSMGRMVREALDELRE